MAPTRFRRHDHHNYHNNVIFGASAAAMLLSRTVAGFSTTWIEDPQLRRDSDQKLAITPTSLTLDLDLQPAERWLFLREDPAFRDYKKNVLGYIGRFVPKIVVPILASIVSTMHETFYPDYAEEMVGLSKALDVTLGEVVLINLIYQLEGIASGCEIKNTTGPCPPKSRPGLCTGFVANGPGENDPVWQGRNLDWNLDPSVLQYVKQVNYQRSGHTVFTGVQVVGMVGITHGVKKGGFSVQVNARDDGGNVLLNMLEQILRGGKEPTHHLRRAFEIAGDFGGAEEVLTQGHLANPIYFIMAGANHGEGGIITRGRQETIDVWRINEVSSKDSKKVNAQPHWMRLETNYDHWEAVPAFDDRRTPGVEHATEACKDSVTEACVQEVMLAWPTKNFRTDITSIICPRTGYMNTTVWVSPSAIVKLTQFEDDQILV